MASASCKASMCLDIKRVCGMLDFGIESIGEILPLDFCRDAASARTAGP